MIRDPHDRRRGKKYIQKCQRVKRSAPWKSTELKKPMALNFLAKLHHSGLVGHLKLSPSPPERPRCPRLEVDSEPHSTDIRSVYSNLKKQEMKTAGSKLTALIESGRQPGAYYQFDPRKPSLAARYESQSPLNRYRVENQWGA